MIGDEVRQSFIRFFQEREHKVIPGSSLVPRNDPTLLLTSAGMVQIKPYFLGLEKPPCPRLVSCQKCFRTTDINLVGDNHHLTFFEMLGNFSVGDYFKREVIPWAWEFITQYLSLSAEKLWVTIFSDDDEAYDCWRKTGVSPQRILRLGEEDNFWGPAGDSGPCGPCSEIHYDMGENIGCGKPECRPGCSCGRFTEIWNLVFTQYNQDRQGRRVILPHPNIDTGMGLERVTAIMEGKLSPYETDLFMPIIQKICCLTGLEYGKNRDTSRAIRIIAEHGRGIVFLVSDGVLPSNGGEGYVLRRILRRAVLFGRRMGLHESFLGEIAEVVINRMGTIYPEIVTKRDLVMKIVDAEEKRFGVTLDAGINLAERIIDAAVKKGNAYLAGDEVFKLHDTYGFPGDLTAELAQEKGIAIDWDGFKVAVERQKEKARAVHHFVLNKDYNSKLPVFTGTEFVGYTSLKSSGKVISLEMKGEIINSASEGDEINVVLDKTSFYGEQGGQTGDKGEIIGLHGSIKIDNAFKEIQDIVVHRGVVIEGTIATGEVVDTVVDAVYRQEIACNHTATHLLQAAMREILGSQVFQKGSQIEAQRFRFDFSYFSPITRTQLLEVQRWVNGCIRRNLPVKTKLVSYSKAIADGAIALFEEKYGEMVREVEIGDPAESRELCGGTHIGSTGEIGLFLIANESSIGTGLHRIEAMTGKWAELYMEKQLDVLTSIIDETKSSFDEVETKVQMLLDELNNERKHALLAERKLANSLVNSLSEQAVRVGEINMLSAKVPSFTMPIFREMGDLLLAKLESGIIVLAMSSGKKPTFLVMVTPDLVQKGFHAGKIIKQIAEVAGGSGGGKANIAQAGGKLADKIDEALNMVEEIIASQRIGNKNA